MYNSYPGFTSVFCETALSIRDGHVPLYTNNMALPYSSSFTWYFSVSLFAVAPWATALDGGFNRYVSSDILCLSYYSVTS